MVKKLIPLIIAVLLCGSAYAATYTPYYGTISSTYLSIFKDVAVGVVNKDYVAWRNSDSEYLMYYGDDLTVSDGVFDGGTGTLVGVTQQRAYAESGTAYYTYYSYTIDDVDDITVNAGDMLVYSSAPGYPSLKSESGVYRLMCIFCKFSR